MRCFHKQEGFKCKDIEAARQLLYSYDAITKLNLKKSHRRQGPAKDKTNVEDILLAQVPIASSDSCGRRSS